VPVISRLRRGTLCVVAEVKRGSPSAGMFGANVDAAEQAAAYERAGAAAISVLTDAPYFGGSLDDLRRARSRSTIPLLRKDFIIDPYQLLEARAYGADLVLLIAAALDPARLQAAYSSAHELGMTPMVEINTPEEAAIARAIGATLVGINNRDLRTFEVDRGTTARLRPLLPDSTVVVALSGIRNVEDARMMRAAGADAVLIGEALVRSSDPGSLISVIGGIA
jgi:indole-3-glycerol phosphate synthase